MFASTYAAQTAAPPTPRSRNASTACVRKTTIASVASDPSACTSSARASRHARASGRARREILDDEHRDDEPDRGQPREPGQHEGEHEERQRREHEPAAAPRDREPPPRRRRFGTSTAAPVNGR